MSRAGSVTAGNVLDINVLGTKAGTLRESRGDFVFTYEPGLAADRFVSLAMPVREQPWIWPRGPHPCFQQILPEGVALGGSELSVLAGVGAAANGRVTVTAQGQALAMPAEHFDVDEVLHGENTLQRFADLARRHAGKTAPGAAKKFTTSQHIVKGSEEDAPFLGFNEHFSMRMLQRLNAFPVAKTRMSDDGRALVVERFDVDASGAPRCGVEDMCGLLGLPPSKKYSPSTEQVLNAARPYFRGTRWEQQRLRLAWLILSTYLMRNANCHAKNIALVYTNSGDVEFSPVSDTVTTQAYPRHADSLPALSIAGRRSWTPGKTLSHFFATRMNIPLVEYGRMVEALCDAAADTAKEVDAARRQNRHWHSVAKNMLQAWAEGTRALSSARPSAAMAM